MTIETNKQVFLDLLHASIPDPQTRNHILATANDLIVADALRDDLTALQSKRMRLVYGAFKRHNPEYRCTKPPLDQVLSWLLLSSGLPYIERLEERMTELHRLLMEIGMIGLDDQVTVMARTIVQMRVLSKVDPMAKPARLRKQRSSRKVTMPNQP